MGFNLGWAGFHGVSKADVLGALGLKDSGEADEYFETPFAGSEFPGGWYVVVSNDPEFFLDEGRMAQLAKGGRAVSVAVLEGVMYSAVEEFSGGASRWSVVHASEDGPMDLEVTGSPPGNFAAIGDDLTAQQQGDDDTDYIFDVPLKLAESIVGFKHDEEPPGSVVFTRLDR